MNRNDFYKELFSRYALDEEKIRMNAIKQAKKPAWQKFAANYWKPAVGTAAAVAVTAAAVAYTSAGSPAPDITEPPLSALSAAQRLNEAEQNYYNLQAENQFVEIYITFAEPVSYNNIIMAFSTIADSGEIQIEALYTDSGVLSGSGSVRAFGAAHSSEKSVTAAKVSALSVFYRDIQDLPKVYLAELASDALNDSTFLPITVDEDPDPLFGDGQYIMTEPVSTVVVTTTPFEFDTSENSEWTTGPVIGSSGSESTTLAPPDTTASDTGSSSEAAPETSEPELTEPEYTEPDDTEFEPEFTEPDEPETTPAETTAAPETADTLPNEITSSPQSGTGVSLLTELYELNVENSLETCLVGNNAVVLTKNAFYMYTFAGLGASQSCTYEINSPKISYKSNEMIILTGCSSGDVRNIIAVVDIANDEVHTYDVSTNIGKASIGAINYSSSCGKFFIKSVLDGKSYVYEASISSASGISFRPLVESDGPVFIVGYKDYQLYLAKSDSSNENTGLYSFNCMTGDILQIAYFTGVPKIRRGCDLESFALISDSGSFIYDVNLGMLITDVQIDESTELVTNGGRTCFRTNGTVYEIGKDSRAEQIYRAIVFDREAESDFEVNQTTPEKVIVIRKGSGGVWTD